MNFDLTTTNWTQVTGLTDDTVYLLQAKSMAGEYCEEIPVLFAQSATTPADNKSGIYTGAIKFKKVSGTNIYIKGKKDFNIQVEEVQ